MIEALHIGAVVVLVGGTVGVVVAVLVFFIDADVSRHEDHPRIR